MNEQIQTIVVGMLPKETTGYGNNDMIRRIYSVDGIAPTIRTYGGGNQEPKVMEIIPYDDYNSRIIRGGCSCAVRPTFGNKAPRNGMKIIAYDEQNRNLNDWGGCGTLTTDGSSPKHNNRVVEIEGGDSMPDTNEQMKIRIRKLTPKECWR